MTPGEKTVLTLEAVLSELLIWIKLIYGPEVGKRIAEILDTEEKRQVYECTDGDASVRDIAEKTGVNKDTISRWWREWAAVGILQPGPIRDDRPARIISLRTFGLI